MPRNPIAEAFGYPVDNMSQEAQDHRRGKLCPFHNSDGINCTKNSATDHVVNVASVPKRSPFRYPGGKTWLVPRVRQWLLSSDQRPEMLIEPFAGGGIVSLTAVAENLVERAHMVELDYLVAAVWETIINDDDGAEWLAERIVTFDLTLENVKQSLEPVAESTRERAFQAILKNRVNRGGIMAPGAGLVKLGEEGKGLRSRWYPETLKKRILAIAALRERLIFQHSDGLTIMRQNAEREHAVFFIDPPYTASQKRAGSRLYSYPDVDHRQLFRLAAGVAGDVLLTYDDADEVRELAAEFGFNTQTIAMKNTHHARMSELLIGNDFAWLRS